MARGNPNFKKAQKTVEADPITDQEVESKVEAFDVTPEPITDQTIIDDFAKLASDLNTVMKIKAAKSKPSRHYFAISQQVQMWGRNFQKSLR